MYQNVVKPTFDFLLSFVVLTLLSPIYILIYLLLALSKIDTPLFFQPRPGKNEKVFNIVKFKTMTDEQNAQGELLPDKERLTRLGGFLRNTSLDELPQLINVLKGDMSLIGPRPLRVRYLPYYSTREAIRHTVKPGITGWAQVSGRNGLPWDQRLEIDAHYTEKLEFLLDCKIILLTFIKVFDKEGLDFSGEPDSLDEYRLGQRSKTSKAFDIQ